MLLKQIDYVGQLGVFGKTDYLGEVKCNRDEDILQTQLYECTPTNYVKLQCDLLCYMFF